MQRFLIAAVLVLGVFVHTHAEENSQYSQEDKNCENHRSVSNRDDKGVHWNITCDSDGFYDPPLQCTVGENETKTWCTCYNPVEAVTSPSTKRRYCGCPLAAFNATQNAAPDCDIPKCSVTGKYQPKQCCIASASEKKCQCVDSDTGKNTTESTTDETIECPE